MSAYFIANILIKDEALMQKYADELGDMVKRMGGEYLAVDNSPTILEGAWDYSRLVLLRFPDEETLKLWYDSAEYQKVLKFRLDATQCDTIMVKGKR